LGRPVFHTAVTPPRRTPRRGQHALDVLIVGFVLALAVVSQEVAFASAGGILETQISVGQLHGTLESPSGKGPFPVALIISGSGPVDRDGNSPKRGLDTNCYKLLAGALAQRGIATLRYDKRGVGQSAAAASDERTLSFSTFVGDAVTWGRKLRRDPRFSTLVIVGHSEGALVGIASASRFPVNGFVSVAGAGEPVSKLMLRQLEPQLPPDAYQAAQTIIADLQRGILVSNVPPLLDLVLRPSVQPYLVSLFRFDPVVEIAKLKAPILIVQGERDLQVNVSDAEALAKGAPGARLVVLPKMNHVFKDVGDSPGDNLAAYHDPTREIDPAFVDAVSDFIHHVTRKRSSS
jgi:pimeloyl-ACP methyl ester carboxylesterase